MSLEATQQAGAQPRLRRVLEVLRANVPGTGRAAPDAFSPGVRALRILETALSVPLLLLIVGIYLALGALVTLVLGGFLSALLAG